MEKVLVVGLGYIGLPTALVAAEHGLQVVGFDIDAQRVACINNGDPVIQEPEIFDKLKTVLTHHNFRATTAIEAADYFIIAVPTPFVEDKKADLSYVWSAADSIATVLKPGDVVILESTVPVGTTEKLMQRLHEKAGLSTEIYGAHCPERVLPGKIFKELIHNPRIIGGINPNSVNRAKEFYKYLVQGSLYLTDATTAEMVKLVENSSRDVAIAFANQVASMATEVGLDPYEVIELANKHPRVDILRPGCGVGGHCIAVDPWFLVETFPTKTALLKTARTINDEKPQEVVRMIAQAKQSWQQEHHLQGKPTIAVLGLTYKPDIDDLRESPALFIAQQLQQWHDSTVVVVEPHVTSEIISKKLTSKHVSFEEGITADIIVCLVAHRQFSALNHREEKQKALDFCGLLHKPRQESQEQERLFWPASSIYEWPLPEPLQHRHTHNDSNQEYTV